MTDTPTTALLDVNETLLDLSVMEPLFADAFGDGSARKSWFALLLQLALTHTVTGQYQDFSELGRAALTALGQQRGQPVPDDLAGRVADTMRQLPPHPDTRAGLEALKAGGVRLVALTNNPLAVVELQLQNAGLRELFDAVLSADAVRVLKPGWSAYEHALRQLEIRAQGTWMVAAHGWDLSGASGVGLKTAFVARPGAWLDPLSPAPTVQGRDLREVAAALLAAR